MTTDPNSPPPLPVSVELLQCLDQFTKYTQVIFEDLSRSSSAGQQQQQQLQQSARGGPEALLPFATSLNALEELSYVDERLAYLLNRAQTHAKHQRRIEELEDKLVEHEIQWRDEINTLESDRKRLKSILERGKKDTERIEQAKKAALKPSTILSYAKLLAPYTSAPPVHRTSIAGTFQIPASGPGGLPPGSILPYPTEEVMRRGILAFAEVSNIGETTEMTGVRPPSPNRLLSKSKEEAAPTRQPVPQAAAPVPRRPYPAPLEEEEEDIMLDLDLNPDL